MKYKASVTVTLKDGVRDPQGAAIDTILRRIKIQDSPNVRVGKFFRLEIEGETEAEARKTLEYISQEVLSNPILEKYEIYEFEEFEKL